MSIKNKKSGFTIIEILVVIAIIGLLSSVVLVGLTGFRKRGRDARRIADLRQTQSALELYYAKFSHYPAAARWSGDDSDTLEAALKKADIGVTNIADDPTDGQSYMYRSNGQGYIIAANLEIKDSNLFDDSYRDEIPTGYEGDPNLSGCGKEASNSVGPGIYCIRF